MFDRHGCGCNPNDTNRAWSTNDGTGERMGLVWLFLSFGGRREVDVQSALLNLGRIDRDLIRLVPSLSLAALTMKFPVMPGTHHILAVEPTFSERTADVITDS
jgi:hypothetical protein